MALWKDHMPNADGGKLEQRIPLAHALAMANMVASHFYCTARYPLELWAIRWLDVFRISSALSSARCGAGVGVDVG
jgi:hypothetical protein